jgi:tRNA (cytidine/uridine-2'-O-)-methyltransferase
MRVPGQGQGRATVWVENQVLAWSSVLVSGREESLAGAGGGQAAGFNHSIIVETRRQRKRPSLGSHERLDQQFNPQVSEEYRSMPAEDEDEDTRLHVVLVEPEIAANAGAVGRTCVAAGAMLWLVRPLGFHLDDRHRRRAGLDYWEYLRWRVVDHLDEVIAALGSERLWSFSTKGRRPYTQAPFRPGDALIFGPESRGLPPRWIAGQAAVDRLLRIPIRAEARSLNLANAVAVGLFEAVRQVGG